MSTHHSKKDVSQAFKPVEGMLIMLTYAAIRSHCFFMLRFVAGELSLEANLQGTSFVDIFLLFEKSPTLL